MPSPTLTGPRTRVLRHWNPTRPSRATMAFQSGLRSRTPNPPSLYCELETKPALAFVGNRKRSVSGIGGAEESVGVGADVSGILIIEAADRQSTAEHDVIELKPDRQEAAAVELAFLDRGPS